MKSTAETRSSRPGRSARAAAAALPPDAARELRELSFLHEFAQLLTSAQTWDELMRTIVDRTTEALQVEASSFYLTDRDGEAVTLAATNGLDRHQIGRVRIPFGQGLTGRSAAERRPIASKDVHVDPRFKWIPGLDQERFSSWLSVPLPWNDRIVGVLNVQTIEPREFTDEETKFLVTIAALLAGIVEKGRLRAEQERQLEELMALDAGRAELLSIVTHELRTPLSVVRAYVDLLADAAGSVGVAGPAVVRDTPPDSVAPGRDEVEQWRQTAIEQVMRLDRLVDSILASASGEGLLHLAREPFDVVGAVAETIDEMSPLLRAHPLRWEGGGAPYFGLGDEGRFRQVLEHLLENEAKYAVGGVSIGAWRTQDEVLVYVTDDGPGIPIDEWETVFDAFVRGARRPRGSGIGLYAGRRLMESMGGRVWLEGNGFGGSRFMVAVPAAPAFGE